MRKTCCNETYKVVFNGHILPGMTEQEARVSLAETFLLDPIEAARVQFDGQDSVLYKSNSSEVAFEVNQRLNNAGLQCQVRKGTGFTQGPGYIVGINRKYALLSVTACAIALMAALLT